MRKWIGVTAGLGAALGAVSSIHDGLGLMVVMGCIGAMFGCALGSGLCALVDAISRKKRMLRFSTNKVSESREIDVDTNLQMELAKKWSDDKDHFPVAGDIEVVTRVKTGSPDLTRLNNHSGF